MAILGRCRMRHLQTEAWERKAAMASLLRLSADSARVIGATLIGSWLARHCPALSALFGTSADAFLDDSNSANRFLNASTQEQNRGLGCAGRPLGRRIDVLRHRRALLGSGTFHSARAGGITDLFALASGDENRALARADRGGAHRRRDDLRRDGGGGLGADPATGRSGDEASRLQRKHSHQASFDKGFQSGGRVHENLEDGRGSEERHAWSRDAGSGCAASQEAPNTPWRCPRIHAPRGASATRRTLPS